jgi:hypothetical protein
VLCITTLLSFINMCTASLIIINVCYVNLEMYLGLRSTYYDSKSQCLMPLLFCVHLASKLEQDVWPDIVT